MTVLNKLRQIKGSARGGYDINICSAEASHDFVAPLGDFKILVPGPWYQDLVTKILVPRFWYQDLSTRMMIPRSWYHHLSTKILVPRSCYQYQDLGTKIPPLRSWFQDPGAQMLAPRSRLGAEMVSPKGVCIYGGCDRCGRFFKVGPLKP